MTTAGILAILSMLSTAEPTIIQMVHDLLAGGGGETDQAVLTADAVDWQTIIAKAQASLPPAAAL